MPLVHIAIFDVRLLTSQPEGFTGTEVAVLWRGDPKHRNITLLLGPVAFHLVWEKLGVM